MSNIIRKRGDTYGDVLVVKSSVTRQPVNITGCTFLMTLNPSKVPLDDTNNLYQLVGTIVDADGGQVEFAPSDTQADQLGKWYFDIQMTDASGRVRTIDSGRYTYKQDITK